MFNDFNFDKGFSLGYKLFQKRDVGNWSYLDAGGGGSSSGTTGNSGNGQGGGGGAIQSSGSISLSEIQSAHGGSNPISLSEYYSADTGVPTSGAIDVSDFYGTAAIEIDALSLYLDPGNTSSYSGSGTTWTDISDTGNDGTLSSSNVTHSSSTNGGIFTIAAGGYISFGTSLTNISEVVRGFTFQAFIKPTTINSYHGIFGAYGSTSGGRLYNWLRIEGGRLKWFTTNSSGSYQQSLGPYLTNNTWVNVCIVVTSNGTNSGQCKFYINGSLNTTNNLSDQSSAASNVEFRIGQNTRFSSTPYNGQYYGDIGVYMWYSKELTASEISDNYDVFKSRYGLT